MSTLAKELGVPHGPSWKNRFVLAPLTNQQSNSDGTASVADLRWFDCLAQGDYSVLITCATNVQANGKCFTDQLGIYDDRHIQGLSRMADIAHKHGAVAHVQLHHAGMKARRDLIGDADIVAPTTQSHLGARELTTGEVEGLREDFVAAARRAQLAGLDGVELHGAFNFILAQFASATLNRRTDRYGGDFASRNLLLNEIIDGIRAACGKEFQIGYRISVSAHDEHLEDVLSHVEALFDSRRLDYLDVVVRSLDTEVERGKYRGENVLGLFAGLQRGAALLGASGEIMGTRDAQAVLEMGYDFPLIGSAAIIHSDFPGRALTDADYQTPHPPIPADYFRAMGLSPAFVDYLKGYDGFAAETMTH